MKLSPGAVVLVRHGEPALSRRMRLSAEGYRRWWATYEAGGLKPGQTPPDDLVAAVADADAVFSSTRLRSIESATAITRGRAFEPDALYIEAPLPPPDAPDWLRLPPRWWGVVARIWWWLFDHHEGQETRREAERRAEDAAAGLEVRAARGERVVVIAHGFFNLMIGRALEARGWRRTLDQGFRYWCARRFEPPLAKRPAVGPPAEPRGAAPVDRAAAAP
jgi:broad specificity phosphatase PhoE